MYLSIGGCAGLGLWAYLERTSTSKEPETQASPARPLDTSDKFIPLKLKKVMPYNHNTSKFVFELPNSQDSVPVASCVLVKSSESDETALKDKKGKPIVRPYTPVSVTPGELVFLIKKYDSGNMSKYIHSLTAGKDSLSIKGPVKKFNYQINEFDEVVCIGGGSGITPLHQILDHALSHKENKTKFKLLFANVTEADILMREEFDAMKKIHPNNFDIIYAIDKPGADWKGATGFIDKSMLQAAISPPSVGSKIKIFICGPPGQVAAIAGKKDGMKQGELGGVLKELGYSSEQVFKF